jgi:hypothetical protein
MPFAFFPGLWSLSPQTPQLHSSICVGPANYARSPSPGQFRLSTFTANCIIFAQILHLSDCSATLPLLRVTFNRNLGDYYAIIRSHYSHTVEAALAILVSSQLACRASSADAAARSLSCLDSLAC